MVVDEEDKSYMPDEEEKSNIPDKSFEWQPIHLGPHADSNLSSKSN